MILSKRITFLNTLLVTFDFIICLAVIAAFAACGYLFKHWWINLFSLIPLALFSTRGVIFETDAEKGGEDDAGGEADR